MLYHTQEGTIADGGDMRLDRALSPFNICLRLYLYAMGPAALRLAFRQLFVPLKQGKALCGYESVYGNYFLLLDAAGFP